MAKGLIVKFYKDAVYMKAKSEKTGKPEYEDRVFVSIIPIGDNKTEVVKEATDAHKARFAEEWDRFERGEEDMYDGTPLKQWPPLSPSHVKMLEHYNIYVVEQLVELDDASIQRLGPGIRDLQAQAKAFVAKASDNAATQRYAVENERLKDDLGQLKEQMKALGDSLKEVDDLRKENLQLKELAAAQSMQPAPKAAKGEKVA